MEPIEWVQVLSYVRVDGNQKRSWPTAMVVLTRLAGWEDGGLLTGPDAAAMAGVSEAAGRRVLLALERMKIIIRDPGSKLKWCALNEDWRRWRVGWAIPPAAIEAQLAKAREERAQNVLERISARSKSGRSWDRIARSEGARSVIESALEEVTIARSKGARMPGPVRAPMSARTERQARAAQERAIRGTEPSGGSRSGLGDDETPPPMVRIRSEEERCHDLGAMALKAKVLVATIPAPGARDKWLSGPPLRRLNDLVEQFGLEEVELAMADLEPGVSSPVRFVENLAAHILLAAEERAPAAPAAEPAAPNVYELAEQRRQEALAQAGSPLPPEEAMAQLAAVRSQWRPGWQDEGDGEGPEAIAR